MPVITLCYAVNQMRGWYVPSDALVLFAGSLSLCLGALYGRLELSMYHRLKRVVDAVWPAARPAAAPATAPPRTLPAAA